MKREMQYKHAIHNDSTKVHNTIKRNGIYQYQRRIPSDLVKVAAFGYKKIVKLPYSILGTL